MMTTKLDEQRVRRTVRLLVNFETKAGIPIDTIVSDVVLDLPREKPDTRLAAEITWRGRTFTSSFQVPQLANLPDLPEGQAVGTLRWTVAVEPSSRVVKTLERDAAGLLVGSREEQF